MKILCTNRALRERGGSESYLETVAVELRRLEHEVVLYAPTCGAVADSLRGQGFQVHDSVADLPADIDVIHGQHLDAVGLVRERFPTTPLVFVTHSWFVPVEDPRTSLAASVYVAFNERTHRRLLAHASIDPRTVVRLRQPVEITFADQVRTPIPQRARVAVAVSRKLDARIRELQAACDEVGILLSVVGRADTESPDARREMMSADIVFAVGRTALEAMAMARAVYVVDESTVGGWITDDSYALLESTGFTGPGPTTGDVAADLARYTPTLGLDARRLAVAHHAAQDHAAALVEVYGSVLGHAARAVDGAAVAGLAGENFALTARVVSLDWETARLRRQVIELESLVADLSAEVAARTGERDARTAELAAAEAHVALLEASRSWRVTAPLRAISRARWTSGPAERHDDGRRPGGDEEPSATSP